LATTDFPPSFVVAVGYGMDKKSGTGFRDKYPGSVSKPNNFPLHPNGQILGLARFGKPNPNHCPSYPHPTNLTNRPEAFSAGIRKV
jgi:hypothetical protein